MPVGRKEQNKNKTMPKDMFEEQQPQSPATAKMAIARKALQTIHQSLGHVIELLEVEEDHDEAVRELRLITQKLQDLHGSGPGADYVVEGVFDGEKMIAQDGSVYEVPANYASKSKLLEGDILKLTINKKGDRIFKQIAPAQRTRAVGTLAIDDVSGSYYIMVNERVYRVNPAAVTYYRGEIGDEVVALIAEEGGSWAAIESIMKR